MVSRTGRILSRQSLGELALGAGERHAHGVGGGLEHRGDLARFELLPRPQSDDLGLGVGERVDGGDQLGVGGLDALLRVELGAGVEGLRLAPARSTSRSWRAVTSTLVGEAMPGNAVAPGERVVGGLVEPSPDDEQRVGQDVGGVVGVGAPSEVALQRLVDVGGNGFEACAAVADQCSRHSHVRIAVDPVSGRMLPAPVPHERDW